MKTYDLKTLRKKYPNLPLAEIMRRAELIDHVALAEQRANDRKLCIALTVMVILMTVSLAIVHCLNASEGALPR